MIIISCSGDHCVYDDGGYDDLGDGHNDDDDDDDVCVKKGDQW